MAQRVNRQQLRQLWEAALAEDGAANDVTTRAAIDTRMACAAVLAARQDGTFAGSVILDLLREAYPGEMTVSPHVSDGEAFRRGDALATLEGTLSRLLSIERTLLNFLQRLCGVATLTRAYVDAVAHTEAKILDTRKTIPGWRDLDKYAERCGGGRNHRTGLHDAILVKDNHLAGVGLDRLAAVAGRIVEEAREFDPVPTFIEFEVDTLDQLDVLLGVEGIDVILLDNLSPAKMREAIKRRDEAGLKGKLQLEASGGVNLETVKAIAETGVDRISVGALTHSAPAADIGLDIQTGA